jgi:hypothetical protein
MDGHPAVGTLLAGHAARTGHAILINLNYRAPDHCRTARGEISEKSVTYGGGRSSYKHQLPDQGCDHCEGITMNTTPKIKPLAVGEPIVMIRLLAALSMATTAIAVPLAATAQADSGVQFQSPSGNIFCAMSASDGGQGGVDCQIGDHTYVLPPKPCEHSAWGDRFGLTQGSAPVMACHNDTIKPSYGYPGPNPAVPTLDYGQTRSVGVISCDSEPSGMMCTDTSTGHFFRVSSASYQIG